MVIGEWTVHCHDTAWLSCTHTCTRQCAPWCWCWQVQSAHFDLRSFSPSSSCSKRHRLLTVLSQGWNDQGLTNQLAELVEPSRDDVIILEGCSSRSVSHEMLPRKRCTPSGEVVDYPEILLVSHVYPLSVDVQHRCLYLTLKYCKLPVNSLYIVSKLSVSFRKCCQLHS